MASLLKDTAENATKPNAGGKEIPDNVVKYLTALGGEFVCAARVTLTPDEKGKHNFDFTLLPELISVRQTAKALAVSPTTFRRLLEDGTLVKRRVGRATTVCWDSVWALMKDQPDAG